MQGISVLCWKGFTLSGQIAIINKITWGKRYVYIIAGGDEDAYEECYAELKDLLYKVKKKLEWQ